MFSFSSVIRLPKTVGAHEIYFVVYFKSYLYINKLEVDRIVYIMTYWRRSCFRGFHIVPITKETTYFVCACFE